MLLHLTEHCSLQCPHCMNECTPNNRHMELKVLSDVIKFIKRNARILLIGGGEPTEHPKFFECVEMLVNSGMILLLCTNGRFLKDDNFTKELSRISNQLFGIQISVIEGLYPHREETLELYKQKSNIVTNTGLIDRITIIDKITVMDKIGRAAKKSFKFSYDLYKRQMPNCINPWLAGRQVNSFKHIIMELEAHKTWCKPTITYDGRIVAGESISCVQVGTIYDKENEIYNNIRNGKPCMKCFQYK